MLKIRRLFLSVIISTVLVLTRRQVADEPVNIHFIDVGQGDAILIDRGQTEILIDGGDGTADLAGYLRLFINGPLELMIATHPDYDHIGGLVDVLNSFNVLEIWWNGETATSATFQKFDTSMKNEGAAISLVKRGFSTAIDSLNFNVLSPPELFFSEVNDNSVVLRVSYGDMTLMLMGDAGKAAEAGILDSGSDVRAKVFKVGHHGSRYSSSPAFISAVSPEVAVYMAGTGNKYGHPHEETITTLKNAGVQLFGTDKNGTIVITSDGKTYSIKSQNN